MAQVIDRVFGMINPEDGSQETIVVGQPFWLNKVTVDRIERVEQNLGTYGITWYVAYDVTGKEIMRMNALATAEVILS